MDFRVGDKVITKPGFLAQTDGPAHGIITKISGIGRFPIFVSFVEDDTPGDFLVEENEIELDI